LRKEEEEEADGEAQASQEKEEDEAQEQVASFLPVLTAGSRAKGASFY
jgi:hypothetical protein